MTRRKLYKVSAVDAAHESAGARWTDLDGWRLPSSFGDPEEEQRQVVRGAGLMDLSAIGKLDLKGARVESDSAGLASGRDLAVLNLKPGHALLLTPPGEQVEVGARLETEGKPGCLHVVDVTSAFASFALVGPRSRETLARLTSVDLREKALTNGGVCQTGLARVHVIIYRDDWGQLPAFWLFFARDVSEYAWDAILDAGGDLGLTRFGLAAQQRLGGRWQGTVLAGAGAP